MPYSKYLITGTDDNYRKKEKTKPPITVVSKEIIREVVKIARIGFDEKDSALSIGINVFIECLKRAAGCYIDRIGPRVCREAIALPCTLSLWVAGVIVSDAQS